MILQKMSIQVKTAYFMKLKMYKLKLSLRVSKVELFWENFKTQAYDNKVKVKVTQRVGLFFDAHIQSMEFSRAKNIGLGSLFSSSGDISNLGIY